jgi:hypothetical protein
VRAVDTKSDSFRVETAGAPAGRPGGGKVAVSKVVGFGTLKRRSKRRAAHGDKPYHVRQKVEEWARIGVLLLMRCVPAGRDRCGALLGEAIEDGPSARAAPH